MATLCNAVTANGAQTGASHTGPCTIMVHRDSVFDGANVSIEIADTDTATDYTPVDGLVFTFENAVAFNGRGTYFLRAVVGEVGTSTSITMKTTQ